MLHLRDHIELCSTQCYALNPSNLSHLLVKVSEIDVALIFFQGYLPIKDIFLDLYLDLILAIEELAWTTLAIPTPIIFGKVHQESSYKQGFNGFLQAGNTRKCKGFGRYQDALGFPITIGQKRRERQEHLMCGKSNYQTNCDYPL